MSPVASHAGRPAMGTGNGARSNYAGKGGYTTWYTLDGAIDSCVVAYQPLGAADLAASLVNLKNPGTKNGVGAADPTFNASYGWAFLAASSQAVKTGVLAADDQTIIIRYSDYAGSGVVMGCISTLGAQFRLIYGAMKIGSGVWSGANNCVATNTPILNAGVYGLAGKTGYRNGAPEANVCAAGTGDAIVGMAIGARAINGSSALDEFSTLKVQAVWIGSAILDAPTMLLLSNAMAALV